MSDKYCILQDDQKDCGVCSLLSIIKYYNGNVSKEYLRELTKTTNSGVNAINILRTARELGFEAYGLKGKIKNLKKELLPVIAHISIDKKYNHFVVIYKIDLKKDKILVMDPARGYIFFSFSNFMNLTTNYYIVLKPKQSIPKIIINNNFFDDVINILSKYKIIGIIILFLSLFYTLLNIFNSYNFKLLFNELNMISSNNIFTIFVILFSLIIIKYIVNLFRQFLLNNLSFFLDNHLVNKIYHHIINLPYLYFKNHTNGDLLTRINDLGNLKDLLSNFIIGVFVDLILAIAIFIVMINLNFSLSLIIIIILFLYVNITVLGNKLLKNNIRENYQESSSVNNYLVETLASFETIKNLSLQKYICKRFYNKYTNFNNNKKEIIKKMSYLNFFKNSILTVGNLLILYQGALIIKEGNFSINSLITFITLSNYLIEPIKNILDLSLLYQNTKESVKRVKEIYNIPQEKILYNENTNIRYLQGRIDISNVSYSYNGVDYVLNNLSLEIKEGNKVLVCSESGSGKSTLIKLLIKYLDNNYTGNITIDGFDLKKIDIYSLRNNICYISQNEYLYTDTVYENITLGRKIPYKKFLELAKNLYIDEIVSKSSLGFNYLIENNGENISGGEKGRILIARSLIGYSNIYIYDETFSSLDINKERNILKYLFSIYKDKTFIIVSHRKSNMDLFNQIIEFGGERKNG